MAFLLVCVIIGLLLFKKLNLTMGLVILGAVTATIVELFSIKIDDNLTIAPLTALVMKLVR